jgi:hypothetical protein
MAAGSPFFFDDRAVRGFANKALRQGWLPCSGLVVVVFFILFRHNFFFVKAFFRQALLPSFIHSRKKNNETGTLHVASMR